MWNERVLEDLPFRTLENDASVAYALDADLTIAYCNRAWDRFAAENGGIGLERDRQAGRAVLDVVSRSLAPFYEHLYRDCRFFRHVITHEYECSSARIFRRFQMKIEPLPLSGGILVSNRLMTEHSHDRTPREASKECYLAPGGSIFMCAHCRCVREAAQPVWDWVPKYVERPPANVTHTLCQACAKYHYSNLLPSWEKYVNDV